MLCLVILIAGRNSRRVLVVPDESSFLLLKDIFDDLSSIVIEREGQRIEMQRNGSRWKMLAPVEASVDQGALARLMNGFDSVVVNDRLSYDEIKKRGLSVVDYGLYPARARVIFKSPKRNITILIGAFSAIGDEVYVRKNKSEQVLVVPRAVYDVIPEDANALRSRRLIDCDRTLVNSIDIRRPGYPFIRLVKVSGAWRIEQPLNVPASAQSVDDFLDNFFGVRVFRFAWPTLDNVMDVADYESALKMRKGLYGLDDETGITIHINTFDGSFESKVIIGHRSEKIGEPVYALLDNSAAIGAISNSFADVVSVTPSDFRSMRVFEAVDSPVKRLQLIHGNDLFVLSQTNDLWRIDSPASEPVDQEVVHRAIEEMIALEAGRIVTKTRLDESAELGGDISYVEFQAADSVSVVSIKKADLSGTLYELSFADSSDLFYVDGSNMPPAMIKRQAVLDFRDRTLLSFPVESISRVTIKRFGETALSVEYVKDDEAWHPVAGEITGPLNVEAFERVLNLLSGFRADKVVKIGMSVDDAAYYGFKEPWLEINLDVNIASAVRKTLLVGRSAGSNLRYVMVRGDQSIFTVEEQRLSVLTEGLFIGNSK